MPRDTWTLVTVTYNSANDIRRHWPTSFPENVDWVVVDNRSSDDSVLEASRRGALVLRMDTNAGFSAANNAGFRVADSDFVAFVNPDVTVDFDGLDTLAEAARRNNAIVGPQLINPDGTLQPNGRGIPSLLNKVLNRSRGRRLHERYRIYAEPGQEKYVTWLMGAAVAGQRDTFRQLGGPWNEAFFLYYEDSELGLRSWENGIPVVLSGSAIWTHGWARETSRLSVRAWRNELLAMRRFYSIYPRLAISNRSDSRTRRHEQLWGQRLSTTPELQ